MIGLAGHLFLRVRHQIGISLVDLMTVGLQVSMVPHLVQSVHLVFQKKVHRIVIESIPPGIVPFELQLHRRDICRPVDIRIQNFHFPLDTDIVCKNRSDDRKYEKQ